MKYKLIDHTADFGIHVYGDDQNQLFVNAAMAMFEQIASAGDLTGQNTSNIKVDGADYPDLMVNWLRELLFLWSVNQILLNKIKISSISEKRLIAELFFDEFDPARHLLKNEIKAVTYHQIQVYRSLAGWESRIIFDI